MMLDSQTTMLAAGCLFVLVPLNIWVITRPPRPATITLWNLAALSAGVSMALLSLRSMVSDHLSYSGYSTLVLAMLLFMQSLRLDLQRPLPRWLPWAVLVSHGLLVQYMLFTGESPQRMAVMVRALNFLGLLAVAFTAARLAWRERSVNAALIGLAFAIPSLAVGSNLVASLQGVSTLDNLRQGVPNLMVGLTAMLCSLLANIGYLGLQLERRHRNLVVLQASRSRQQRRHDRQRELARLERTRTVGLLADSLAHALLQPLAALRVQAEIGERACAPGRTVEPVLLQRVVNAARAQLDRVDEKVGQIRRFLQSAPAQPGADVELRQLLHEVQPLVQQEAINQGVKLVLQMPAQPIHLQADGLSMMQVLVQVLRHAVQAAAGREGACVQLRLLPETPALALEILDNGPGLSAEMLPGLLPRSAGVNEPSPGQGLNLGLLIAWRLMLEAGGSLQIENRPDGEGSSVLLRWPLQTAS